MKKLYWHYLLSNDLFIINSKEKKILKFKDKLRGVGKESLTKIDLLSSNFIFEENFDK